MKALFKENIKKKSKLKTYEGFLDVFTELDGEDFWDNTMRMHAYKSKNPVWLPLELAQEKMDASNEIDWNRYEIDDPIEVGGKKIVIRNGHSIDSVDSLDKLLKGKKLDIGTKMIPTKTIS